MSIAYTVALCTHNHADRLRPTLASLGHIVPPDRSWELLVVDNGCTDGTAELLAAPDWRAGLMVRVVREERLGLSNARNRAIREARGDYLIFIDDDETPDPKWLLAYEQAIATWAPDALGGRIEVLFEGGGERPSWLQDELLGFLGGLDYGPEPRRLSETDTPVFGGNFAFRRGLFGRIGAFDADLGRKGGDNTGGEDTEIYRRMLGNGCDVRWVPGAVIYHRIQTPKLRRGYFLSLHYRMGRTDGMRRRGGQSRLPPAYLLPQLWRALRGALLQRLREGRDATLRKEMNVAYFLGVIGGWAFGAEAEK